jgi:hypothetical protein
MNILVKTLEDVDQQMDIIRSASEKTRDWLRSHSGSGLELIRALKFDPVGCHPINGHDLNTIEQINQTFTYVVALSAARQLLAWHPDVGGFWLAPGAHMSLPLDIMSVEAGVVGAETFAAVDPRNNGKLSKDLKKLASRDEEFRYVFFSSPKHPTLEHLTNYDFEGVQVWSVEV